MLSEIKRQASPTETQGRDRWGDWFRCRHGHEHATSGDASACSKTPDNYLACGRCGTLAYTGLDCIDYQRNVRVRVLLCGMCNGGLR